MYKFLRESFTFPVSDLILKICFRLKNFIFDLLIDVLTYKYNIYMLQVPPMLSSSCITLKRRYLTSIIVTIISKAIFSGFFLNFLK